MQAAYPSNVQPLMFSSDPSMQIPVPSRTTIPFDIRCSTLPQGAQEAQAQTQAPPITQHGYGYENDPRGPPVADAPDPTQEEERAKRASEYANKHALAHESLQNVLARHRETLEATRAVMDAFWLGLQYSHSMDDEELAEFMASLTQNGDLCGKVGRAIAEQQI